MVSLHGGLTAYRMQAYPAKWQWCSMGRQGILYMERMHHIADTELCSQLLNCDIRRNNRLQVISLDPAIPFLQHISVYLPQVPA